MPHQFIKDLKPGQRVEDEVYLIQSRDFDVVMVSNSESRLQITS